MNPGFGKRNTNNAFVVACNKFVYFDALPAPPTESGEPEEDTAMTEAVYNSFTSIGAQQPSVAGGLVPPRGPRAQNTTSVLASRPQFATRVSRDSSQDV